MRKIITLTGCMGSGKDTLLRGVIRLTDVNGIVSTTSRPMRQGEQQGREYNFIHKDKAIEMFNNGDFIEHRKYKVANGDTWIYGIEKKSLNIEDDKIYIVIVDLKGLYELERYLDNIGQGDTLTSIYVDCNAHMRINRALDREGILSDKQVEEICRRNMDDMIKVLPAKNYCDYSLKNETYEDLEKNIKIIQKIIKG
ncbi:MAG: hypothetical protein ACRCX8_06635 [Sarcina sp.]